MPTFAHLLYGLCILIPIMYYTRDKFNYKVAFIFLANQLYGPDTVAYFFVTPFHSIVGFAIFAFPLAYLFSYTSRFSIIKSEGRFPLKFEDEGKREVNFRNAYCLTLAGGISHFFIDQFWHLGEDAAMHVWNLYPTIDITHINMLSWGGAEYHSISILYVFGEIFAVLMIILALYYLRKGYKDTFKTLVITSAFTFIIMVLGSFTVGGTAGFFGGERELGAMLFCILYILIPLFLLMYAARNVEENPVETPDEPKRESNKRLKRVALISLPLPLFFILFGVIAMILSSSASLLKFIQELLTGATAQGIFFLGASYFTMAVILLIGLLGLLNRNRICRYIVIAGASYFYFVGFPLAIALFLCEKDIKELFNKESRD